MGKFSEKLLNAFSMKDDDYDDDYDEDYEDDEEFDDDYDDEEEKGGFFSRVKKSVAAPAPKEEARPVYSGNRGGRLNQEVCVFKPSSIEDSREITETLLQGKAVVINFEGLHVEISQRIIDFISGSCYALDGNLQKISNYIFIATPDSVDISGDFQELIDGGDNAFDLSGFKSPLF